MDSVDFLPVRSLEVSVLSRLPVDTFHFVCAAQFVSCSNTVTAWLCDIADICIMFYSYET